MEQISLFDDEKIAFPLSHDDVLKLHAQYIAEGETDPDAFTWKETKNGRSYFFYGKKVFELVSNASGAVRLRIQKEDDKPITLTPESPDLRTYLDMLKETKKNIFQNLTTETFGCCNDFIRCSDAMKCLHSEDRFYNGCMYRKNLEAGRIFYGKNKNV